MTIIVRCLFYKAITPTCDIVHLEDGEWSKFLWSTPQERRTMILPKIYKQWKYRKGLPSVREVVWIPYEGQDRVAIVGKDEKGCDD